MSTSRLTKVSQRIVATITVASFASQAATAQKVYWADASEPGERVVKRANLDGSEVEELPNISVVPAVTSGHTLYYVPVEDDIHAANIDGTGCASLLIGTDSQSPRNIRVDTKRGKIYWLSIQSHFPFAKQIQRADFDGGNVEVIVPDLDISENADIYLDVDGGKLYWDEQTPANNHLVIRRTNLDGTDAEDILPGVIAAVATRILDIEIDLVAGRLYWADEEDGHLFRVVLDGSRPVEILIPNAYARWLALDPDDNALYWAVSRPETHVLRRSTLDGTETVDLMPLPDETNGVAFDLKGTATLTPECSGSYDRNHDGDIDLLDFGAFQACFTGQGE